MAGPIPAKLKGLNIAPFAHRAAQLDKVKPIIAYWCMSCARLESVRANGLSR